MCKSHDPFSSQALSLELAGERRFATLAALAIHWTWRSKVNIVLVFSNMRDILTYADTPDWICLFQSKQRLLVKHKNMPETF